MSVCLMTCFQPVGLADLSPSTAKYTKTSWVQEELTMEALKISTPKIADPSVKKQTTTAEIPLRLPQVEIDHLMATCQDDVGHLNKLVATLKACADQGDIHTGSKLHDAICRRGLLERHYVVGNAIVNLYAKCGALAKAQEVFDSLPLQDVVTWNTLITGYAQHRHGKEVLDCFESMQSRGFNPTAITIVCVLSACGSIEALEDGQKVHVMILREGLLDINMKVANALIDMYAKSGDLVQAEKVFNDLHSLNVVTWNTLVTGYMENDKAEEVLSCFDQMLLDGYAPNRVTFVGVLRACGSLKAADKGLELHNVIVTKGSRQDNLVIGTALVDMYAKCGMLIEAQAVFDELEYWDVISWTSLITGYAQHRDGEQALMLFQQMQSEGFPPNAFTYASALRACGCIGDLAKGQDLHARVLKEGLLGREFVAASTLVDIYAKGGLLERAYVVFEEIQVRDVLAWNALVGGYMQHDQYEKALDCYNEILDEGLCPNAVTYACISKACGSLGAASMGQELHNKIAVDGLFTEDIILGTALVDMYANCGLLKEAHDVFDRLPNRDVIAWNALLVGYAQLGVVEIVSKLFTDMVKEGIQPSHVTFIVVLNACSHKGLVCLGERYFETLTGDFGMKPTMEHLSCMIDLFGRAGHLDLAAAVVEGLPLSMNPTMWHAFLHACIKWGHLKLGDWAFHQALKLDEMDSGAYIFMENVCAATGLKSGLPHL